MTYQNRKKCIAWLYKFYFNYKKIDFKLKVSPAANTRSWIIFMEMEPSKFDRK